MFLGDCNMEIKLCSAPDAKVLIVDDMNTNLRVAKNIFLAFNIKVDLCKSGIDA